MENSFIAITPKSTLIRSCSIFRVPSMGQIELYNPLTVLKQIIIIE